MPRPSYRDLVTSGQFRTLLIDDTLCSDLHGDAILNRIRCFRPSHNPLDIPPGPSSPASLSTAPLDPRLLTRTRLPRHRPSRQHHPPRTHRSSIQLEK